MLLDHLKLVASYHEVNKMTCQNLAVCFGPVLLSQRQETSNHNNRVFTDSEELASALDFKKHIEVLHYLLQLWPGNYVYEKVLSDEKAMSTDPKIKLHLLLCDCRVLFTGYTNGIRTLFSCKLIGSNIQLGD